MRFALILLLILIAPIMAQAQSASPSPKPVHATSEMRTELFEVKHRDPAKLAESIFALGSGSPATRIDHNRELKTITVRDYPENIETIRAALARLDKPERVSANLDIQLHVIAATRAPGEKVTLPAGLDTVVGQLRQTLKYGNYRYVTTFLHRTEVGGRIESSGTMEPIFPIKSSSAQVITTRTNYEYNLAGINLAPDGTGKETIQIQRFEFGLYIFELLNNKTTIDHGRVKIETELGMREGEMVVVGTANVGSSDEAVIVVITAKKSN